MENKFINRYNTFCKSLSNLAKSKTADPKTDFVLEGTVQFQSYFRHLLESYERYSDQKNGNS